MELEWRQLAESHSQEQEQKKDSHNKALGNIDCRKLV
jgi:hypothetical protein